MTSAERVDGRECGWGGENLRDNETTKPKASAGERKREVYHHTVSVVSGISLGINHAFVLSFLNFQYLNLVAIRTIALKSNSSDPKFCPYGKAAHATIDKIYRA